MPSPLRLPDDSYMRHFDVRWILTHLDQARCVEVCGFSNVGKSALMRLLAEPDVWLTEMGEASREFLPVYIDCNRMLEMTDHGFYELVLRCLQESSPEMAEQTGLVEAYERLIAPASEFQVPLSFSKGLTAALDAVDRRLVLLFDEFDEPFEQIDSRVFLNLRAKKDRYRNRLAYVTATGRPLLTLRPGEHCAEFCELFVHQSWRLAPLTHPDVSRYVHVVGQKEGVTVGDEDVDFVHQWSGGHPAILAGVMDRLAEFLKEEDDDGDKGLTSEGRWALHRKLTTVLRQDAALQSECNRIWLSLDEAEQQTILDLFAGRETEATAIQSLSRQHLLLEIEGKPRLFGKLFANFIQQKERAAVQAGDRLHVDTDSGEIFIDGHAADTLTRLEYQLMVLLYDNADKIVDKYQIVTGVWGEEYIDSVDDARIEKLVSRLRQKIEPDPGSPQFVTTVRGRGYRLVLN